MSDHSFKPTAKDLHDAIELMLTQAPGLKGALSAAEKMPEVGLGESEVLQLLAPMVLGYAAPLGSDTAFAHMDPPTPWITWVVQCWNASLNQNLLHPDVSPVAGEIEARVMQWLCPYFGMSGGHLTPGSTVSNLTALWAARDAVGIKRVITSEAAHVSITKATKLLGLDLLRLPCNSKGELNVASMPDDLSEAALVLTAGTTSSGALDSISLIGSAPWTHVDAAWAGPLMFSKTHAPVLSGLERADSIAVSAHKWMYQPKESGVLMFRDVEKANSVLSTEGPYLAKPNVGLLGSHGATAVPLLATLLAWGRQGLAHRIEDAMLKADALVQFLRGQTDVEIFSENVCGVVLWRSSTKSTENIVESLPAGAASTTVLNNEVWVRHVSANPNVDIEKLQKAITVALK